MNASSPIVSSTMEDYQIYCATSFARASLLAKHSDAIYHASVDGRVQLLSPPDFQSAVVRISINVPLLLVLLQTKWLGSVIVYSEYTSSTQDMLRKRFRDLRHRGIVAIAGKQTAGRGRRGRQWESPEGSLAFSMRVPVKGDGSQLVFLQYLAALAVVECLELYKDWNKIPIRIKWPNDLLVNSDKVGGILCETTIVDDVYWVTIGLGLNLSNESPTRSLNSILREVAPHGDLLRRETVLAAFLKAFEELFETFEREGFGPLEKRYLKRWIHTGQCITLENREEGSGTVVGLSKSGFIRLKCEDSNGSKYVELEPDSTSFDFAAGVVRDKIQL